MRDLGYRLRALCGTDLCVCSYQSMTKLAAAMGHPAHIVLRACYAKSGTDLRARCCETRRFRALPD
eukprot:3508884-Rhodomonas_salina.3